MDKNEIEAIYPLSPMQKGMLFHTLYEAQAGLYFEQLTCKISAGLDVAAFKQAWQQLVQRHSVLRTQFMWENLKDPLQVVRHKASIAWRELDWGSLDKQEQQAQVTAFLASDRSIGMKLTQAPLLRITLIQLSAEQFYCIVSFHHLILDGWSMPLLLDELLVLYTSSERGKPAELENRRPFRDYITWLQRQDQEQAEAFWREYLRDFHAPHSLLIDKGVGEDVDREVVSTSEVNLTLAKTAVQALRSFARRHKVTMNTLVQGAWALLLSRYSGVDDVVFGGVVSGRPPDLQGVEQMIGLFINTLPVRIHIPVETPISAWLQAIQLQQIEVRQYEYSSLVQVQGWSEIPRGQSLFESILVFENYPTGSRCDQEDTSLRIEFEQALEQTNYPLSLEVSFTEEQFFLRLVFDNQRFDEALIHTMLTQLGAILDSMAAHPDESVATISLLTDEERRRMLDEWNMTRQEYPRTIGVHTLFEEQVASTPQAPALEYKGATLTYAELNERANELAHYLRSHNVGPDVLVGLALKRSPEMVIGLLAVLKAGGAYVPLDPSYPEERLAYMISDTGMPMLLTTRDLLENLPLAEVEHVVILDEDWQGATHYSTENPGQVTESAHLAYVIYTSGSTGRPKGVQISHQGLANYLNWCGCYYRVRDGHGSVVHSSLSFDLTVTSLFPPLLVGEKVVLAPEEQDITFLSDILRQGHNFSVLKITPAHLELLNRTLAPEEMPGVARALVIGGEVLHGESLREWRKYAPLTRIINEYGPTEAVVGCCIYELAEAEHIQGPVPIGHPIANTRLFILDSSLSPVPVGITGELHIGGDGLARGYLHRPDLTAKRFIADPFSQEPGARLYKTGDLARYRADGTLEYLGRLDHQVKIRGYRIEPGEIEATLRQHPAVQEVTVLARVNANTGNNRLVAYWTAKEPGSSETADLRAYLKERLPEYMLPSAFVFLDTFPLTSNGKIDRDALPEPELVRSPLETTATPLSPVEEQLAGIWGRVLGLEQVGVHENFFELGGDSIQGIQIIDQARRKDLRLTLKQLFRFPTIAELALVVEIAPSTIAEQGEVVGNVPLTPIQHWFFDQNLVDPHHWNQSMVLESWQEVNPELLKKAFVSLLHHHDALRMQFVRENDGWRQEDAPVDGALPFSMLDLSSLAEDELEQRIEKVEADLQGSLNLAEGPLVRVALFQLGKRRPCRILIIVHHLVVDSVSWRVLIEDLQTAYLQLARGLLVQLSPKTTSFKQYAELLVAYAQSADIQRELPYWAAPQRADIKPLPLDYPTRGSVNSEQSARTLSNSLTAEETTALVQKVPEVYHTQMNDVLLTALALTLEQWSGHREFLIDMEGHGREDIQEGVDLSHTTGWFTSLFPVLLDLGHASGPGEALQRIKEQLRAVPNRGVGYGLLRYLCSDSDVRRRLHDQQSAELSFNYLGQLDQKLAPGTLFRSMSESNGFTHSPRAQRSHRLDIGGAIVNGQLHMQWIFSEQLHRLETIEQLAADYMRHVRSIIQHCLSPEAGGYTPSDFPLANLNEEKLNALSLLMDDLDEEEATI